MSIPFLTVLFRDAVASRSDIEDIARREFILNVLILGALFLLVVGIVIDVVHLTVAYSNSYEKNSFSSLFLGGLFAFFLGLYALSRSRHVALASYLFIGAFFLLTALMGLIWGVDVPAQIVFYPLVIVMAGILISTRFAFATALLVALTMLTTGFLQRTGALSVNQYWKGELWTWSDVIMIIVIYLIVATVSWLSNREIEKSLFRARRSERELKEERDSLEVRVEERTQELRKAELERMDQAYHFIEFGRIASGIFHDVMNPLAALSLNIDRIADAPETREALAEDVARAKRAAAHMQELMDAMRKHLTRDATLETFSVRQTIEDVAHMLSAYARSRHVRLSCVLPEDHGMTFGSPVAFTQIMTNLISNAIQAYPDIDQDELRNIDITLSTRNGMVCVTVRDYGSGISEDVLPQIFEPFFTTKGKAEGTGIGLSLAKRLVEKDFGGSLTVESIVASGSTFTVLFTIREP